MSIGRQPCLAVGAVGWLRAPSGPVEILIALSILVSISMLSIKTAAFYWFLMGVIIVMPRPPELVSGGRG